MRTTTARSVPPSPHCRADGAGSLVGARRAPRRHTQIAQANWRTDLSTTSLGDPLGGSPRRRDLRVRGLSSGDGGSVGAASAARRVGRRVEHRRMPLHRAPAKAEGTSRPSPCRTTGATTARSLDGFTAKYGITINELNPDAGSGDEIEAIKANKDNPGPQAPDVIDVGLSLRPAGQDRGPAPAVQGRDLGHDPGRGQGCRRLLVRRLLRRAGVRDQHRGRQERPEGLGRPAQARVQGPGRPAGDPPRPTRPSPASGPPALANGGSLDNVQPGPRLLQAAQRRRQLRAGHRQARRPSPPARRRSASRWTYNGLADKDTLAGNPPIEVVVPTTGRFGGMYVQAISTYAPHPNAAKLWMEYLYSDEGQHIWLKGYCNPIRYDDLVAARRRSRPTWRPSCPDSTGRRPADARPDHGGDQARSPTAGRPRVGVTVK